MPRTLGRLTEIDRSRLQTFNFQVATKAAERTDTDATALAPEQLNKYVHTVLRFVPVEVAMRHFGEPLAGPEGALGYASLGHARTSAMGSQGYEHDFNAAVLFSDVSGFTKLTNMLLGTLGDEGAEILPPCR